jgi:hypothetical protein
MSAHSIDLVTNSSARFVPQLIAFVMSHGFANQSDLRPGVTVRADGSLARRSSAAELRFHADVQGRRDTDSFLK